MGVVASNDYDVIVVEAYLDAITKKEAFSWVRRRANRSSCRQMTRETLSKAAFQVIKDADLIGKVLPTMRHGKI